MPRAARVQSASAFYHVVMRGAGRQTLFESDRDRLAFLERAARAKEACPLEIHAYALMDNHVHLLVRDEDALLADFMRRLAGGFAMRYNASTGHVGHVFQDRYLSEPVDDDAYYLTALRYIVQNPLKAGLGMGKVESWTSLPAYFSGERGLVETEFPTGLLGGPAALRAFLLEENGDVCLDVTARSRMGDAELRAAICEACSVASPVQVKSLPKGQRDAALLKILALGASDRRVERETGVGRSVIRRVRAARGDAPA